MLYSLTPLHKLQPHVLLLNWDLSVNYKKPDARIKAYPLVAADNFYPAAHPLVVAKQKALDDAIANSEEGVDHLRQELDELKKIFSAYVPNRELRAWLFEIDQQAGVSLVMASEHVLWYLLEPQSSPEQQSWSELQKMIRHLFPSVAEQLIQNTEKLLEAIRHPKKNGEVMRHYGENPDMSAIANAPDKNLFLAAAQDVFGCKPSELCLNDGAQQYQPATVSFGAQFVPANSPKEVESLEEDIAGLLRQKLKSYRAEDYIRLVMAHQSMPDSMKKRLCYHPAMLQALKEQTYDVVMQGNEAQQAQDFAAIKAASPALHTVLIEVHDRAQLYQVVERLNRVLSGAEMGVLENQAPSEQIKQFFRSLQSVQPFPLETLCQLLKSVNPEAVKKLFYFNRTFLNKMYEGNFSDVLINDWLEEEYVPVFKLYQWMQGPAVKKAVEEVVKLSGVGSGSLYDAQEKLAEAKKMNNPVSEQACEQIVREKQQALSQATRLMEGCFRPCQAFTLRPDQQKDFFILTLDGLEDNISLWTYLYLAKFNQWGVDSWLLEKALQLTRAALAQDSNVVLRGEKESLMALLRYCSGEDRASIQASVDSVIEEYREHFTPVVAPGRPQGLYSDENVAAMLLALLKILTQPLPANMQSFYHGYAAGVTEYGLPERALSGYYNRRFAFLTFRLSLMHPDAVQVIAQSLATLTSAAAINDRGPQTPASAVMIMALFDRYPEEAKQVWADILKVVTGLPDEYCEKVAETRLAQYQGALCDDGVTHDSHPALIIYRSVRSALVAGVEKNDALRRLGDVNDELSQVEQQASRRSLCQRFALRTLGHTVIDSLACGAALFTLWWYDAPGVPVVVLTWGAGPFVSSAIQTAVVEKTQRGKQCEASLVRGLNQIAACLFSRCRKPDANGSGVALLPARDSRV